MATEGRQTRGRQKIEIKKIEKEDDLLVSFSKRRSGIYKKASDMITLCGGEVGIVIFSPSGKPFSFGHPSIDSVINRYLNQVPPENNDYTNQIMEAHRKMRLAELARQYNELINQLEALKDRRKSLQSTARTRRNQDFWWVAPLDELGVKELRQIYASMAELHMTISNHLKERSERRNAFGASSSSQTFNIGERSAPQPNPNFDANIPSGIGSSSAFLPGYGFGCDL